MAFPRPRVQSLFNSATITQRVSVTCRSLFSCAKGRVLPPCPPCVRRFRRTAWEPPYEPPGDLRHELFSFSSPSLAAKGRAFSQNRLIYPKFSGLDANSTSFGRLSSYPTAREALVRLGPQNWSTGKERPMHLVRLRHPGRPVTMQFHRTPSLSPLTPGLMALQRPRQAAGHAFPIDLQGHCPDRHVRETQSQRPLPPRKKDAEGCRQSPRHRIERTHDMENDSLFDVSTAQSAKATGNTKPCASGAFTTFQKHCLHIY